MEMSIISDTVPYVVANDLEPFDDKKVSENNKNNQQIENSVMPQSDADEELDLVTEELKAALTHADSTNFVNRKLSSAIIHPNDKVDYEVEMPIGFTSDHILKQSIIGPYRRRSIDHEDGVREILSKDRSIRSVDELKNRSRLDVTVGITNVKNIDYNKQTFQCKLRVYAFWRINLHEIGLGAVADRALENGHFAHMTQEEIEHLATVSHVPNFIIMNSIYLDTSDVADIRVYGGRPNDTGLFWNKGFDAICKDKFSFHDFPFDKQELSLELRLNDPVQVFDVWDMVISTVQIHEQALTHSEWIFREPKLSKENQNLITVTTVVLPIHRHGAFYIQNVVYMLTGITSLLLMIPNFYAHDEEYANILNVVMVCLSAFLITANVIKFKIKVYFIEQSTKNSITKEIKIEPQRSWYTYRYSAPHYLPPIPDGNTENDSTFDKIHHKKE
eukprot:gene15699-21248_t